MKRHRFLSTLALALVGAGMMAAPARAVLSYNTGDLFIGFFATGGTGSTLDYVVNIGPASSFTIGTAAFKLSLTGVGADLTTTFGSNWNTRADLYWGVFGAQNNDPLVPSSAIQTIYASRAETTLGTQATPYTRQLGGNQGGTATNMVGVGQAYANGNNTITGSHPTANPVGLIQAVADINSYGSFQNVDAITSFNSASIGGGWNTFAGGASSQAADLFLMTPRTASNQPGVYQGTFTVSATGDINFAPTVVPEPSTYRLMIGAALVLLVVARQRRKAQA